MRRIPRAIVACALLAGCAGAGAGSGVAASTIQAGFRVLPAYYTRDMGATGESTMRAVPLGLVMRFPRQELRATIAYVDLYGQYPDINFRFWGPRVIEGRRFEESGLGDFSLKYAYLFLTGDDGRPALSGSVRVKFPTADEDDGLGTGETDYEGALAVVHTTSERWIAFARAGYVVRGDPPNFDLSNTLSAVAGGRYTFNERSGLIATIGARAGRDYRVEGFDSLELNGESAIHLGLAFDRKIAGGFVMHTGALVTRSDGGDGFGVGLGFSWNDDDPTQWMP
jgi:hypothetical protein